MTVSPWCVSAVSGLFWGRVTHGLGHKPSPGTAALAMQVWQSRLPMGPWMQRMESVKGSSATASFILQLAELGPGTLQLVQDENSASLLLAREERELLVKLRSVWGFCVLSRAWSILRLLQAPLPLGARGWACASREAAEGIFWESWPELTVILENEAGRGGEGHRFFWSNLGVRHLYRVSWGPWAVHPWHVGVHVGPCCWPGESSRAPAGLPPPAGAQDSRKRERAWPSSVLWAFVWERGVGFRCLQMPGFVKTPDVFHVKCVRLSACVCVLLANTDFLMLLCDICCLGSVPNIKGSLPKYLFLFSV